VLRHAIRNKQIAQVGPVEQQQLCRRQSQSTRLPGKHQVHQKYWQELLGQTGGRVHRPLLELSETEKIATRQAFEACGLAQDFPADAASPSPDQATERRLRSTP